MCERGVRKVLTFDGSLRIVEDLEAVVLGLSASRSLLEIIIPRSLAATVEIPGQSNGVYGRCGYDNLNRVAIV